MEKPNIFKYTDFRAFLRDRIQYLKSQKRPVSYRYLSRIAGYKSTNYINMVVLGKRNLSLSGVTKLSEAFKLSRDEQAHFSTLVEFAQTNDVTQKEKIAVQIVESPFFKRFNPIAEAQYRCYNNWYTLVILQMIGRDQVVESPTELARLLTPPISAEQASTAIKDLLTLGMIARDENGILQRQHQWVGTEDEVASSSVTHFYQQMLKLASESIARFPKSERELGSATIAVSEECAKELKNLLRDFRSKVFEQIAQDKGDVNRVYQIGMQLFPVTHKIVKQKKNSEAA